MASMKAIGVASYGPVDNFEARVVPKPGSPKGCDVLVQVKACSVNLIDIKIRGGVYDDTPDYYDRAPKGIHIIGYDGAGTILDVGPDCVSFKPGDDVSWVGATTRQGSNAEYQLVNESHCAHKPKALDFVDAASYGLTFGTAFQSLFHRLEIKPREDAGILIINGGGGVGSAAIQLARNVLELRTVIATTSREDTADYCKKMGATHVINHKEDLLDQVKALDLDVDIKYVYILAPAERYIDAIAKICAPFSKVCTIVQADVNLYGSQFMSKSVTFSWDWLGTAAFHGTRVESYRDIFGTLSDLFDRGILIPTLTKRYKLTLEGLKEDHRQIESKATVGKLGLGMDDLGEGQAFC